MKKIKRIPTILALLLLLTGIGAGIFLITQQQSFFLQASPEITPKQLKITNVTDQSLTISWITEEQTSGFIKYDLNKDLSLIASDDRDQSNDQTGNFSTHHVTLKNLQPQTTYLFKIGSGGKVFDDNGESYQTKTGPTLQEAPPAKDVAYGVIADQTGNPLEGAIVYLSLPNAVPQSTLSKTSGNWALTLSLARTTDLASFNQYDPQASIEEIFVQGGNMGVATAIATTINDSPLPKIILGQTFDFRQDAASQDSPQQVATPSSQFSFEDLTPPTESKQVTVTNPKTNEEINTQKPEFMGTGPAGETVTIKIESPEIVTAEVTIDPDGTWQWTPAANLSLGSHTLTASLISGERISRSFTVLAAGEENSPAFTATPSATLTPSPGITPTSTPSPIITATPAGRTSLPSTESGVPESGYLTPTFLISIMGISLVSGGILASFLLKRKLY